MSKLNNFWEWYKYTAFPIGLIGLGVLLALVGRTVLSTVTCGTVGYSCKYAFRAEDAIADSMFALIDGNMNQDIVVTKKHNSSK